MIQTDLPGDFLDDAFSGRTIAFLEGPLKDIPFRLVRTFGDENNNNNVELNLAANFVIDLSEVGEEIIEIDGTPEKLYEVAELTPNRLVYDTNGVGFRFILNGSVFNGLGLNPSGLTGVNRIPEAQVGSSVGPIYEEVVDPLANIEFTLNTRLTGSQYRGGTEFPQPDEAWDAPDWENPFLAWQPSDHRRAWLDHRTAADLLGHSRMRRS